MQNTSTIFEYCNGICYLRVCNFSFIVIISTADLKISFLSALGKYCDNFVNCPAQALNWNYRKYSVVEELLYYIPDIICLQVRAKTFATHKSNLLNLPTFHRKWTTSNSCKKSSTHKTTPVNFSPNPTPPACIWKTTMDPMAVPSFTTATDSNVYLFRPAYWEYGTWRATRYVNFSDFPRFRFWTTPFSRLLSL